MDRKLIEKAMGELGAAIAQSVPTDDQIIMDHVREAYSLLRVATYLPRVPEGRTAEEILQEPEITSKTSMGHLRTTQFSMSKEPAK